MNPNVNFECIIKFLEESDNNLYFCNTGGEQMRNLSCNSNINIERWQ